jgi:hypothetical protein
LAAQVVAFGLLYVLAMLPLGLGKFQLALSRAFFTVALVAHVLRIVTSIGLPKMKPFSMEELKKWSQQVLATSDVHYVNVALLALLLLRQPFFPIMMSPFLFASLRLASFVQKKASSLERYTAQLLNRRVRTTPPSLEGLLAAFAAAHAGGLAFAAYLQSACQFRHETRRH